MIVVKSLRDKIETITKLNQNLTMASISVNWPESITFSTYLAYKPPCNLEPIRKIVPEKFDWDVNHPKSLVIICIEKLSENWMGKIFYHFNPSSIKI